MANRRVEAAVEALIASGVVTEDQLVHAADVVRVLATLRGIEVGETGVRKVTSGSGKKRKARKRRGRLSSLSDAEFKELYQEMTASELGGRFGVTAGAVSVRASKLGLRKKGKKASTKKRRKKRAKKARRRKKVAAAS